MTLKDLFQVRDSLEILIKHGYKVEDLLFDVKEEIKLTVEQNNEHGIFTGKAQ